MVAEGGRGLHMILILHAVSVRRLNTIADNDNDNDDDGNNNNNES